MGLKNVLGGKLLGFIGKKLDGKKSILTGIGSILVGLAGMLGMMVNSSNPENPLPHMDFETACGFIVSGGAILGLGGKLEKTKKAIENGKG